LKHLIALIALSAAALSFATSAQAATQNHDPCATEIVDWLPESVTSKSCDSSGKDFLMTYTGSDTVTAFLDTANLSCTITDGSAQLHIYYGDSSQVVADKSALQALCAKPN
jgi:hypothetical protein